MSAPIYRKMFRTSTDDLGLSGAGPHNDPLPKEANSEPICLIEVYRSLTGLCDASDSGVWMFWGGLGLSGAGLQNDPPPTIV